MAPLDRLFMIRKPEQARNRKQFGQPIAGTSEVQRIVIARNMQNA